MIANLITAILLALGVATGNVSSNVYKGGNAFNNDKKSQPVKRQYSIETQYGWALEQTFNDTNQIARKYYANQTPHITNNWFQVNNTSYTFVVRNGDNGVRIQNFTILRITSYASFNQENIQLTETLTSDWEQSWQAEGSYLMESYQVNTNEDLSDIIDLTINSGTYEIVSNRIPNNAKFNYGSNNGYIYGTPLEQELSRSITIDNISQNETIQVVFRTLFNSKNYGTQYPDALSNMNNLVTPNILQISGIVMDEQINYEVVDIPELMFTILTLPFAWYSTAFNLTIFQGTPYQINFGNVIMTIVAALILFYLIKKVIK